MFETASSRGDYYKFLTYKMYSVQKELIARKKNKKSEFCIGCT